jgi:hypothetical protein
VQSLLTAFSIQSHHRLVSIRCCATLLPFIERGQKPISQFDARLHALARHTDNLQPACRIIGSRGGKNGFCGRTVLVTVHFDMALQIICELSGKAGSAISISAIERLPPSSNRTSERASGRLSVRR